MATVLLVKCNLLVKHLLKTLLVTSDEREANLAMWFVQ